MIRIILSVCHKQDPRAPGSSGCVRWRRRRKGWEGWWCSGNGGTAREGGGEVQWKPSPNDNTHPIFLIPCFQVVLFPSQPGLPLLLSPSIRSSSLLPFALQNTAMPSAKVSRCTSPNSWSGATAPSCPPAAGHTLSLVARMPDTRPLSLGAAAPCQVGRSSAGLRRHRYPGLGILVGFRYTRENSLLLVSVRSPPPPLPGLHYYFYPGCRLRPILVSSSLAGLLWGKGWGRDWGGGKLDSDQARKKKFGRAAK